MKASVYFSALLLSVILFSCQKEQILGRCGGRPCTGTPITIIIGTDIVDPYLIVNLTSESQIRQAELVAFDREGQAFDTEYRLEVMENRATAKMHITEAMYESGVAYVTATATVLDGRNIEQVEVRTMVKF